MNNTSEIRKLRQAVINAKLNRDEAIYMLKRAEAHAVLDFVGSRLDAAADWKGLGPNEEARRLNTVALLDDDAACKRHRSDVRDAERTLAEAEADVEAWLQTKRDERMRVTEKVADALMSGTIAAELTL